MIEIAIDPLSFFLGGFFVSIATFIFNMIRIALD